MRVIYKHLDSKWWELRLEARVGIVWETAPMTGVLCLISQAIQAHCVTIKTAGFHFGC